MYAEKHPHFIIFTKNTKEHSAAINSSVARGARGPWPPNAQSVGV